MPPWRGAWGVSPHENLKRGELPTPAPAHEWDPERWRILSQRGWGRGVEGAQPLPRGFGGCAPKIKKRGRVAHISHPPRVGPKTPASPKPAGAGKRGSRGRSPLGGFHKVSNRRGGLQWISLAKLAQANFWLLSFLLFLNVLILGCLLLVATGKVVF
jgi:hypothetical protein